MTGEETGEKQNRSKKIEILNDQIILTTGTDEKPLGLRPSDTDTSNQS